MERLRGLRTAVGGELALRRPSERKNESVAGERVLAGSRGGGAADCGFLRGDRCLLRAHWGFAECFFFPKKEIEDGLFSLD